MTEPATAEPVIASKEGRLPCCMQVAKDLLLVIPLRAPDVKADLVEVNPPAAKLLGLVFWDIVIKDDHAAVFFPTTSLTTPRRVSDTASRTASGLMMPRYCRATASGL